MPSILVHGADQQKREAVVAELIVSKKRGERINLIKLGEEEKKIGIERIKKLLPHLHTTKLGGGKIVVIFESQRLTAAAQNALLKLLEEPPGELLIILTTPNPQLLLPTVISRCLPIKTKNERVGGRETVTEEVFKSLAGRRLALFEEKVGYHQEDVISFFDKIETHIRLKGRMDSKSAHLLSKIWQAKKLLRNESANVKLIVDELLLSW